MATVPPLVVNENRHHSLIQSNRLLVSLRVSSAACAVIFALLPFKMASLSQRVTMASYGVAVLFCTLFWKVWNYEIQTVTKKEWDLIHFSKKYRTTKNEVHWSIIERNAPFTLPSRGAIKHGAADIYWVAYVEEGKVYLTVYDANEKNVTTERTETPWAKLIDDFTIPPPPPRRVEVRNRSITLDEFDPAYASTSIVYNPQQKGRLIKALSAGGGKVKGSVNRGSLLFVLIIDKWDEDPPLKKGTVFLKKPGTGKCKKAEFDCQTSELEARLKTSFQAMELMA